VEEGIANVVLEAMQLGTLVLSTDCGGMREVIQDGKNGFIVPVRDPESMAAALQKIYVLADSQKEDIRVAAQATIQQNHSLEKMVHDMCSLYEQVL
ncbi:MAG TPA: glycosyltransferase family 4 protein, partial [Flavobacteriaceae bacterium]|nr:glycosyltransferase family 4 protein [Flavobacteriaceae bacterium]